jgi:hypothetical protein
VAAWLDGNCGADGWAMTTSGMRGVLNDAISIYFADATPASAFVARWCAGSKMEAAGGVLQVRQGEPALRVGAGLHRTRLREFRSGLDPHLIMGEITEPVRSLTPDTGNVRGGCMIDQSDAGGLGLAALALATATLAHDLRRGRISGAEVRAIYNDARALVHDRAGFVVDPQIAQAADDFLSVSDALAVEIAASTDERRRRAG